MLEWLKAFFVMVFTFAIAMVIASFATPAIVKALEKLTGKGVAYYFPKPIQQIRGFLNKYLHHNDHTGVE